MRILLSAALAFALLPVGGVGAQSHADFSLRAHAALAWCHAWADGQPIETLAPEILAHGFSRSGGDDFGWDGGVPGTEAFRVEFWNVDGDRSCHIDIEHGPWSVDALVGELTDWAEAQESYVAVPSGPIGGLTPHHYRDGRRDLVIYSSPDQIGLAGYALVVGLLAGSGEQ